MVDPDSTRWTVIQEATEGCEDACSAFVERYGPVVRAYLRARWKQTPLVHEVEDAVQEVFLDCFREEGALDRFEPTRPGGFRAYFQGVVRNVAMRCERRRARERIRPGAEPFDPDLVESDDDGLSTIFDRAWARCLIEQAADRQVRRAREKGGGAERRVELLRLRFDDGLQIREIARLWDEDPARLHHEYARAREEFRAALEEVVALHHPGEPGEVRRECERLVHVFD